MNEPPLDRTAAGLLLTLVLAALALYCGRPFLSASHETRVLETAREMAERDDWVIPTLAGEPRLQKPPLPYWATMLAGTDWRSEGVLRARLVTVVLGVITAAAAMAIGVALGRPRSGLLAIACFAAQDLVFSEFRKVTTDPFLTAFSAVAVACFVAAARRSEARRAAPLVLLGYLAVGGALLSKGPIALFFTALPVALLTKRFYPSRLFAVHGLGVPVALAPALLWAYLVNARLPDAWQVWTGEVGARLGDSPATPDDHRGPGLYFANLPLFVLPLTLPFLASLVMPALPLRRVRLVFLAGFAFLLALQSRKVAYLLPLTPYTALIIADFLVAAGENPSRFTNLLLRTQAVVGALFAAGLAGIAYQRQLDLSLPSWPILGLMLTAALVVFILGPTTRRGVFALAILALSLNAMRTGILESHEPPDFRRYSFGRFIGARVPANEAFFAYGLSDDANVALYYARRTPIGFDDPTKLPAARPLWIATTAARLAELKAIPTDVVLETAGTTPAKSFVLLRVVE